MSVFLVVARAPHWDRRAKIHIPAGPQIAARAKPGGVRCLGDMQQVVGGQGLWSPCVVGVPGLTVKQMR
jgi:hypothetical protein